MFPEVTYSGVVHRNISGSFSFSDKELVFRSDVVTDVGNSGSSSRIDRDAADPVILAWHEVVKHQVSPASHPKSLLKVVTTRPVKSYTFTFPDRSALDSARREISLRLSSSKSADTDNCKITNSTSSAREQQQKQQQQQHRSTPPSSHYVDLDPIATISTRSSLLASDPALRAQHRLLVLDGGTLTEEDFWATHSRLVGNEYAKISGKTNRGMSSDIKSSLDLGISSSFKGSGGAKSKEPGGGDGGGNSSSGGGSRSTGIVHLGVEEMRQIFLMYPAVHRAYEEKVPLELSEEQFWRKYLESEYFHRDRGRMGTHIDKMNERERMDQEEERSRILGTKRRHGGEGDTGIAGEDGSDGKKKKKEDSTETGAAMGEDEAKNRLAAAGTDDIFSRYDAKGVAHHPQPHHRRHHRQHHLRSLSTTQLAVGKFDLTSTTEVERGDRFLGKDLHPPPEKDSAGSRIIDKYNRHWAIVLHPMDSKAGVDLATVAAKSVTEGVAASSSSFREDEDAKVNGGCDNEMRRLVGFANADDNHADFVRGRGDDDKDMFELNLHNVEAYAGKFASASSTDPSSSNGKESDSSLHLRYAKILAASMRTSTETILRDEVPGKAKGFGNAPTLTKPFPDTKIGRGLLEALTKKMAADSHTEEDVEQLVDELPEEFTTNLASFFRRSTELLRHFFSLRSFLNDDNSGDAISELQKNRLTNIVKGMEQVHREMYELTRNLPLVESKMFKPIMEQLDWAFKLYREDSSKKTRGGFVTVAKGGFVPVAQ